MTVNKRKEHTYRITIEEVNSEQESPQTLEFTLQDREDLFNAVANIKAGSGLNPEQATQAAVAIRLLGPMMMKERKHTLFESFFPHFKALCCTAKTNHKSLDGKIIAEKNVAYCDVFYSVNVQYALLTFNF